MLSRPMIQELSVYEGSAGCVKAGLRGIQSPEVGQCRVDPQKEPLDSREVLGLYLKRP